MSDSFVEGRKFLADMSADALAVGDAIELEPQPHAGPQPLHSSPLVSQRRIDPEDGVARTLEELELRYKGLYSDAEIEAYFLDDCKPGPSDACKPVPSDACKPAPSSKAATLSPAAYGWAAMQTERPTPTTSAQVGPSCSRVVVPELSTFPEEELRRTLKETELVGDALEAAVALAKELQQPLAKARFEGRALEAAMWCRMTGTKRLSDVVLKIKRLAAYLELEDDQAERLRMAIATCLASSQKQVPAKKPTQLPVVVSNAGAGSSPKPPPIQKQTPAKKPAQLPVAVSTVAAGSSPKPPPQKTPTFDPPERRLDPEDGAALTKEELKQRYASQYIDAEIDAYFRDECKPMPSTGTGLLSSPPHVFTTVEKPAPTMSAEMPCTTLAGSSSYRAPYGLEAWLRDLQLQRYSAQVAAWCEENGAVALEEVTENWQEIADLLSLRPILETSVPDLQGMRVTVHVLFGAWRGHYVAEVIGADSTGIRVRHEEDDFVETLPLYSQKYILEPLEDAGDSPEGVATADLLRAGRLRVEPATGAGLVLRWCKMGYLVDKLHAQPGQPELREGDAILAIGRALLLGHNEDEVEQRFGAAFADGAVFVAAPHKALMSRRIDEVRPELDRLLKTI